MNPQQNSISRIAEIIGKGQAGVILVPATSSPDAVASATGLYLGLIKLGKNVSLAAANPIQSELTGADKFQSNIAASGNSLMISFPYNEGAIDKVDYNIQGNSFNLVVTPRQGMDKLDPAQVKYSYTGGNIDFIIVIDAPNLNSLGSIYTDNPNHFQGKDIINIDRHLTNGFFGSVNFVDKSSSSTVELIFTIMQRLNVEFDKDIATNLYAGLIAATNNFSSYTVNANTFDMASTLLKFGAIKKPLRSAAQYGQTNQNFPMSQPVNQIPRRQPAPIVTSQAMGPIAQSFEKQGVQSVGTAEQEPIPDDQKPTPQDWLKPKIFRGGGLI